MALCPLGPKSSQVNSKSLTREKCKRTQPSAPASSRVRTPGPPLLASVCSALRPRGRGWILLICEDLSSTAGLGIYDSGWNSLRGCSDVPEGPCRGFPSGVNYYQSFPRIPYYPPPSSDSQSREAERQAQLLSRDGWGVHRGLHLPPTPGLSLKFAIPHKTFPLGGES